ncbi:phospholipase A2 [Streptomyces sp. G-G2]|uniref:phospholipase A2 n=1 Tax=Streptomyces sp. G-G2 TaxID=3046201 RepID=UPI0024BB7648|nr:phospholipase A2 [Streptomyces sp. G-G2]MDJ0382025.1 phospholipase A2 [Streptomyces sp. G-G2]
MSRTRTSPRTGARHRFVGAATAVLGAAALLLVPASPASATTAPGANATPFNEGGETWDTDGCTDVPDSGVHFARVQFGKPPFSAYGYLAGRFDFHHACKHHDGCYRFRWADRATCDQWFRNDMHASCAALKSNAACDARAELYYWGVRVFGEVPWKLHAIKISMNQYLG